MPRITDTVEAHADDNHDQTRRSPRLKLPVMYTLLRVRLEGETRYPWTGHIYDLSESGMRFELDGPIEAGTEIEVRAMLPGAGQTTFRATGRVVRMHTDREDLAGPVAMGMVFDRFPSGPEHRRLMDYLNQRGLSQAA